MTKLAIKGHPSRSKEIIEILEMLGGKNTHDYICNMPDFAYSINEQGIIEWFISHPNSIYTIFTLEEFLEKYPYKVGDKVLTKGLVGKITDMKWQGDSFFTTKEGGEVVYTVMLDTEEEITFSVEDLQPYKEETMEEKNNNWAKWDLPDGYEFQDEEGNVIKSGVIRLVKKQSQYPKTYEECCKVLNLTKYPPALVPNKATYINQYKDFPCYYEIQKLAELIVCRNAYWKIAGEQMGLGKPWKPDFTDTKEMYYIFYKGYIEKGNQRHPDNHILIFPTPEMRDAFLENFKDLIELCKELL
jgi:hypothetical protein